MFEAVKSEKTCILIIKQIQNLIEKGNLKKGDKLPSERELAISFGVSRPTVREALTALSVLGILEIKAGKGTYVVGE